MGGKGEEEEEGDGEEGAFDVSSIRERLAKRGGAGGKRGKKAAEEAAAAKKKRDVEPRKPKQKARAAPPHCRLHTALGLRPGGRLASDDNCLHMQLNIK